MQDEKNLQDKLIKLIERLLYGFDVFLVLALLASGVLLVYWAMNDIFKVLMGVTPFQEGILSGMGVLLIFYAVSELLRSEIIRLRGGTFSLKVFVGLALAAVIRKILVASLSSEKITELIALGFLILCLAVVYWVIDKVEEKSE